MLISSRTYIAAWHGLHLEHYMMGWNIPTVLKLYDMVVQYQISSPLWSQKNLSYVENICNPHSQSIHTIRAWSKKQATISQSRISILEKPNATQQPLNHRPTMMAQKQTQRRPGVNKPGISVPYSYFGDRGYSSSLKGNSAGCKSIFF